MDLAPLLRHLVDSRLADLAGSQLTATIPIDEKLINQVIAAAIPAGGAVRSAELHPHPGERFTLRVALARPSFLPPFNISLEIERQAELPLNPVLVLRLTGASGLMGMAGSAAGLANGLPPGMRMDGDRIHVDLRLFLRTHGLEWLLDLLEELYVATGDRVMTLAFRANVRRS